MKVWIVLLCFVFTSGAVSSLDLMSAAKSASHKDVLVLLKNGAAVDSVDGIGETALHHACQKKSSQIVRTLLKAGANPNIQDDYGYTPLFFATESIDLGLVDLLLEAGADPNLRNRDGIGPLYKRKDGYADPFRSPEEEIETVFEDLILKDKVKVVRALSEIGSLLALETVQQRTRPATEEMRAPHHPTWHLQ